ncbi:MAG TPA: AraC family transcriptional regulator [Burkholderiales bacterium]|jgi:AraC-like DNA-binding protein|nr:AraC family transcriptional regulator [Burkholderiales bacterium]
MSRPIRVFDGSFGRLQLIEAVAGDVPQASPVPQIVVKQDGADLDLRVDGELLRLTRDSLLFVSPNAACEAVFATATESAQLLWFQASADWLRGSFPAVFDAGSQAFGSAREAITPRIRQLADTLVVEVLNDQFLSHERLEFMLQELMLSIVETYLARRQAGARLWRGSPFADNRIRKALALLRAHPNKELNMNDLANQVGLSRSRFYDLFQTSTGRSPRSYLDLLCVETAIAKLSSGSAKIAEVSAELGFSAQSNFTRFFQQQVGIPPSEYRRAAGKPNTEPQDDPQG